MSEVPMVEQPTFSPKKIAEQDINVAVKDVVKKAQAEKEISPAGSTLVESANSTYLSRLKNLVPEWARHASRLTIQKAALTASAISILAACNSGSAEKQNVPPPPAPTAAASEMPEGMPSATIEFTRTPSPSATLTTEPIHIDKEVMQKEADNNGGEEQEEKDSEVQAEFEKFEPSVLVVDVKTMSSEEWEDYFKKVLGDRYVSEPQLIEEFGEDYKSKMPEVMKKYPGAFVRSGFTKIYENHGDDVSNVMEKTWKYAKLESTQDLEIAPLQGIFEESSIEYGIEDDLGNKGFSITFDEKKIIELLRKDPNRVINFSFQVGDVEVFLEEKKMVTPKPNLDLGTGFFDKEGNYRTITIPSDLSIEILVENEEEARSRLDSVYGRQVLIPNGVAFYKKGDRFIKDTDIIGYVGRGGDTLVTPGNIPKEKIIKQWEQVKEEAQGHAKVEDIESPDLKIVGAYDDKAEKNLPRLFEVAKAYPDKLFVAAGGNNGEDILKVLEGLSDEKPSNLIIVAEWRMEGERPRHEMYGADIYVDNNYLDIPEGSSFSTPVIAAYATALFEKGLFMEEVVETIKSTTLEEDYRWEGAQTPQTNVFDPIGALVKIKSLTSTNARVE